MTKTSLKNDGRTKSSWQTVRLRDICSLISSGSTPPRMDTAGFGGEINWIKSKELKDAPIYETEEKITREAVKKKSLKIYPPDTVALAIYASPTVGQLGYLRSEATVNQACAALVANTEKLLPKFLFYSLRANRSKLQNLAVGVAQQNLNVSLVRDFHITAPENIDEQKRVVEVLSAFDEKIENNNRIIKMLEAMAQAIFKEWFVRGVKGKSQKKRLGEVVELAYGKALKEENRNGGDVLVVGSSGVVGKHDESIVKGPGIVVGRKGVAGSVIWIDDDFYPIDTTFYVKTELPMIFCYFLLKRAHFISGDSAVPGLNREDAYRTDVEIFDQGAMEEFQQVADPMFLRRSLLQKENQKLAAMRDLLLPRLLSGEIRV